MNKNTRTFKTARVFLSILFLCSLFHIHYFHAINNPSIAGCTYSEDSNSSGSAMPVSSHECYACIILSAFELYKVNTAANTIFKKPAPICETDYKNPQTTFFIFSETLRAPPQI